MVNWFWGKAREQSAYLMIGQEVKRREQETSPTIPCESTSPPHNDLRPPTRLHFLNNPSPSNTTMSCGPSL
jgi:hypothetical protein